MSSAEGPVEIIDAGPATATKEQVKTPKRSPAVRRQNVTPRQRNSAQKAAVSKSCPERQKPASKRADASLLNDFLLGKPSASRPPLYQTIAKRKTSGAQPEMKAGNIQKLGQPTGVKNRVAQWQKANAAAVAAAGEDASQSSVEEADQVHQDSSPEEPQSAHIATPPIKGKILIPAKARSTPRKRVVSDSHWMKKDAMKPMQKSEQPLRLFGAPVIVKQVAPARRPKQTKSSNPGHKALPKDFVENNWVNPPVERKIQDWVKRTEQPDLAKTPTPKIRSQFTRNTEAGKARGKSPVAPAKESPKRSAKPEEPFSDSFKDSRPLTPLTPDRRSRRLRDEDTQYGTRSSDEVLKAVDTGPSRIISATLQRDKESLRKCSISESRKQRRPVHDDWSDHISESSFSLASSVSNHHRRTKAKLIRRSLSGEHDFESASLDEIPVGLSAFSVLDVSATGRKKMPKPQRKNSIVTVPNVLKKVYNEGMKIMHDTVDPPRVVISNPAKVESWLNQTSDPFMESDPELEKMVLKQGAAHRRRSMGEPVPDVPVHRNRHATIVDHRRDEKAVSSDYRNSVERGTVTSTPQVKSTDAERPSRVTSSPLTDLKRQPARRQAYSPVVHNPEGLQHTPDSRTVSARSGRRSPTSTQGIGHDLRSERAMTASPYDGKNSPGQTQGPPPSSGKTASQDRTPRAAPSSLTRSSAESSFHSAEDQKHYAGKSRVLTPASTFNSLSKCNGETHQDAEHKVVRNSALMSVLSLADTTAMPGRAASIISAKGFHRKHTITADSTSEQAIQDLEKTEQDYMNHLRTLVDGVVPVLLHLVLSKGESSLKDIYLVKPEEGTSNTLLTKPIVQIGIAAERLKARHSNIPFSSTPRLLEWALETAKIYDEYISVWRLGFQDLVVTLEPAKDDIAKQISLFTEPERVEVAHLLKQPLDRLKYLAKLVKKLADTTPCSTADAANRAFDNLLSQLRRRWKEESARQQDIAASNTDTSNVIDLWTLKPLKGVKIDRKRQVKAKEFFDLDLEHDCGRSISCEVEIIVRETPNKVSSDGDILICEITDDYDQWLLFQPFPISQLSARPGPAAGELILRVIDLSGGPSVDLTLHADNDEIANEFIDMFGSEGDREALSTPARSKTLKVTDSNPLMTGALKPAHSTDLRPRSSVSPYALSKSKPTHVDHIYDNDQYIKGSSVPTRGKENNKTLPHAAVSHHTLSRQNRSDPGDAKGIKSDAAPLFPISHSEGAAHEETPKGHRPSTSPLKNEYQPSETDYTSDSLSYSSDSYGSDSEEDSSITELSSRHNTSRGYLDQKVEIAQKPSYAHTVVANVSSWYANTRQPCWEDLSDRPCSVVVKPGLIETYTQSVSTEHETASGRVPEIATGQLLVAQILTPVVLIRHSNALDVEIHSPPLDISHRKVSNIIRFRCRTYEEAKSLCAMGKQAGKDNEEYAKLEEARRTAHFGQTVPTYERRKFSWFGRKKSYRASTRAPSVSAGSDGSTFSLNSAFQQALKRMSGNGIFDINRSTVAVNRLSGQSAKSSIYDASSGQSSAYTPPGTVEGSLATWRTADTTQFDKSNLVIRLYRGELNHWIDVGLNRITIGPVPPGMQPSSPLYNGRTTRVTLTAIPKEEKPTTIFSKRFSLTGSPTPERKGSDGGEGHINFDAVMGSRSFNRIGVVGIVMNVWEELIGPNGEVGMAAASGGVSGKQRRWMFQCQNRDQAKWIFALLGGGL